MPAETQKARNKRWAAAQPGPRTASPESLRIQHSWPDLHVRLWCNISGLNILAYIDRSDASGRVHRTEVARATWLGKPPTEEDTVLWATAALSTWLEARIMAAGEEELAAS